MLLVLALVAITSQAQASVLCVPKSGVGTIKVRELCKTNERQVNPATVGLQVQGPALYDINGKKVGEIISYPSSVLLQVNRTWLALNVYQDHLEGSFSAEFESTDCSGPGFMQVSTQDIAPRIWVSLPNNMVYQTDPSGTPQPVTARSYKTSDGRCFLRDTPFNTSMVPLVLIVDLDTLFTPPFHIE